MGTTSPPVSPTLRVGRRLTLALYLAALDALGIEDGEAPDLLGTAQDDLVAFLTLFDDLWVPEPPGKFATFEALLTCVALVWDAVAVETRVANEQAEKARVKMERHYGEWLDESVRGEAGTGLLSVIGSLDPQGYAALREIPYREVLVFLSCHAVVAQARHERNQQSRWN